VLITCEKNKLKRLCPDCPWEHAPPYSFDCFGAIGFNDQKFTVLHDSGHALFRKKFNRSFPDCPCRP